MENHFFPYGSDVCKIYMIIDKHFCSNKKQKVVLFV